MAKRNKAYPGLNSEALSSLTLPGGESGTLCSRNFVVTASFLRLFIGIISGFPGLPSSSNLLT
jgi:hypothetical protein